MARAELQIIPLSRRPFWLPVANTRLLADNQCLYMDVFCNLILQNQRTGALNVDTNNTNEEIERWIWEVSIDMNENNYIEFFLLSSRLVFQWE